MNLPTYSPAQVQERYGVDAVARYANSQKIIWRETSRADVGIDGNLEFVNDGGFVTGRLVALQIKSGPSFFSSPTENGWKFHPEDKHRHYWESFPLPVILVLHNPQEQRSYWVDARQVLRTAGSGASYIEVPNQNVLEETPATTLFESAGVQGQAFMPDLNDVLQALLSTKSSEASFPLSYFDLFVHGLTNICRSIYYGMDLVCNAVEFNLASAGAERRMGIGNAEQHFTFGFVKFLLAHDLAQIDYADCLIDWVDRGMQPHFVAPLTSRGRQLVGLIGSIEAELLAEGRISEDGNLRVAQEGFFEMVGLSYFRRLHRIKAFQDATA